MRLGDLEATIIVAYDRADVAQRLGEYAAQFDGNLGRLGNGNFALRWTGSIDATVRNLIACHRLPYLHREEVILDRASRNDEDVPEDEAEDEDEDDNSSDDDDDDDRSENGADDEDDAAPGSTALTEARAEREDVFKQFLELEREHAELAANHAAVEEEVRNLYQQLADQKAAAEHERTQWEERVHALERQLEGLAGTGIVEILDGELVEEAAPAPVDIRTLNLDGTSAYDAWCAAAKITPSAAVHAAYVAAYNYGHYCGSEFGRDRLRTLTDQLKNAKELPVEGGFTTWITTHTTAWAYPGTDHVLRLTPGRDKNRVRLELTVSVGSAPMSFDSLETSPDDLNNLARVFARVSERLVAGESVHNILRNPDHT